MDTFDKIYGAFLVMAIIGTLSLLFYLDALSGMVALIFLIGLAMVGVGHVAIDEYRQRSITRRNK